MHTDNLTPTTWVTCIHRPTSAITDACDRYGLTTSRILLVLATTKGPDALVSRMLSLGLPSPGDKKANANPISIAVTPAIATFAEQHPDQLLARTGTGVPFTAVDENGHVYDVWANIEPLVSTQRSTSLR